MSDDFAVLFSTKINQQTLKDQVLHVKGSAQGRTIELVSKKSTGIKAKIASAIKTIFGTEQRRVSALCKSSKDLQNTIQAKSSVNELETLKMNLKEVENWVDRYNKKLGPLAIFLRIKHPLKDLQTTVEARLATLRPAPAPQPGTPFVFKAAQTPLTKANTDANAILKAFLKGDAKNIRGHGSPVSIADIWAYSVDQKEQEHDYIQWLFPSPKPSGPNPLAPVLTLELRDELIKDPVVQANLKKSFESMLDFFGLHYDAQKGEVVEKSNFPQRAQEWVVNHTHNHLRVTRMLECLDNFGLTKEKDAFQHKLGDIYSKYKNNISTKTFDYWTNPHQ